MNHNAFTREMHVQMIFVGQRLRSLVSWLFTGTGWSCRRRKARQRRQSCRNLQCSGMTRMMRWVNFWICYKQGDIIGLLSFITACDSGIFIVMETEQISVKEMYPAIIWNFSRRIRNMFCYVLFLRPQLGRVCRERLSKRRWWSRWEEELKDFMWLKST